MPHNIGVKELLMRAVSIEFTRLVFLYFVSVLAALLLLVVSNRGAMAKRSGYRSDCAGMLIVSSILLVDNFQSECQALHLFSDNQPIRGERRLGRLWASSEAVSDPLAPIRKRRSRTQHWPLAPTVALFAASA